MLFYTAIFVACIIAAVVIPWLYRLVSGAGTAISQSIRADSGPTAHLKPYTQRSRAHYTSASWNYETHDAAMILAQSHAEHQTSRQVCAEDSSYYGPCEDYSAPLQPKVRLPSAGWLRREDRLAAGASSYKVTRRPKARDTHPKYIDKPLSWQ